MFRGLKICSAWLLVLLFSGSLWAQPIATGSRSAVIDAYSNVYVPAHNVPPDWNGGSGATCPTAGSTSLAYQQATIDTVNFYRNMAGLDSVNLITDSTATLRARLAAQYWGLNPTTTDPHHPTSSGNCYSLNALAGASTSNLSLGWGTPISAVIKNSTGPGAIDGYIDDSGANNESVLGHRRWILYTQQTGVASGDIADPALGWAANSLRLWAYDSSDPSAATFQSNTPNRKWVAWPSPNFVPYQVMPPTGHWTIGYPGANFSAATVTMTRSDGSAVPLAKTTVLSFNPSYATYGDNTLSFDPSGLAFAQGSPDTSYKIVVSGVTGASAASYCYTVTVFDPTVSAPSDTAPDLCGGVSSAQTPTISGQPAGASYNQGAAATALSVTASVTDGGTLSYQWYRNTVNSTTGGTLISGATGGSYTPSTATVGTVYYYVVVTNTLSGYHATNTSTTAAVAVATAPTYGISLNRSGTHDFGAATVGYAAPPTALAVTVTNTGNQPTGALTVALSGANAGSFTLSSTNIASIAVGGTGSFTVRPNAGLAAGTYNATVTVSGGSVTSQTFNVSFTVNPPAPTYGISLNRSGTYGFGAATVGYATPPAALAVTVTNTGNQPTGALTVALSGANAGSFTLSSASIASIAVGGTGSFTVRPNAGLAAGTYTATVTVSGGSVTPQTFNVSFTVNAVPPTYGISLDQTGTYTMPTEAPGYAAPPSLAVAVDNTGNTVTGVLTVALSGANAGSFTLSSASLASIAVGGTGSFTVAAKPGLTEGTYTATVTVSNGSVGTHSFNVSFKVAPPYRIAASQTGTYNFPGAAPGYTGTPMPLTVQVTNTGTQPTGALTVTLSGPNAGDFTVTPANIASLAAGGTGSFTVGPNAGLAEGTYSATVTVAGPNGVIAIFSVSFIVSPPLPPPTAGAAAVPTLNEWALALLAALLLAGASLSARAARRRS